PPADFATDEPATTRLRLYRTGDLARRRHDGTVEILGRADYQVKLRGYRVELGEIEATLSRHPDVNECLVTLREDAPGDKRLVAYLTMKTGKINSGELRSYVKGFLPEYMTPSAFVLMKEWKLTPNGKIDRRQLPAPEESFSDAETEFIAPRTPVEEKLAGIWANLLRLERIGINDNFFDLGGHSLLATQVVSRIRDAFGENIALRMLFETPTVAGLAEQISSTNSSVDGENSIEALSADMDQMQIKEIELLLAEMENISDEEAQELVAEEANSSYVY
ncbi:MAG: non-ribosomal peptide synthetase, partial [Pyrinomonadaceae bacterium]|nr:non-ribosomal peptide synthetase [Pyrinomonadaceae bacterium]